MADRLHLRQLLHQLNDRSYKAYKDIRGRYQFPEFLLCIDRVQGDPFAAPSQVRVLMSYEVAGFPLQTYQNRSRAIALCDYLTRQFCQVCTQISDRRGTGNSGLIQMLRVGQEVLSRTSIILTQQGIEARFTVGLPAQGRRILGYQAGVLLCEDLPEIVEQSLKYENLLAEELQAHIETVEDAEALRSQLSQNQLVAFVADGAILPRRSGV
ncbi:MAG TPA: ATPase, partial [Cyanobacteria bacterium UBA11691]|nr:ATPase [Cyanobacteria bacterium UBA11691]